MRIEQVLIGLLLFSMFMVGGALIFNDVNEKYELTPDTTLFNGTTNEGDNNSVYNVISSINHTTSNLKEKIISKSETSGDFTIADAVDILFNSAYTAVVFIKDSFILLSAIINYISISLGIPSFIGATVFIMFIISVVFTIMYLIFKFKT